MSLTIFQNKRRPFQALKTRSSKIQKLNFSKEINPRFWSKNGHLSNFFFLRKIGHKNVFYNILDQKKTPFQAIKTRSLKSRKIDIFPKGLTHGFGQKMTIFTTFFFLVIETRKMSFTILQNRKTPFQAIKTRSSKSRKIDIFPKGLTHGFGPKMAIFSTSFFLGNIGQENVFYDILERKKAFLDFKNQKFKNSKIGIFPKRLTIFQIFPKGLTHGFGPKNGHFSNFFFFQANQARKI